MDIRITVDGEVMVPAVELAAERAEAARVARACAEAEQRAARLMSDAREAGSLLVERDRQLRAANATIQRLADGVESRDGEIAKLRRRLAERGVRA